MVEGVALGGSGILALQNSVADTVASPPRWGGQASVSVEKTVIRDVLMQASRSSHHTCLNSQRSFFVGGEVCLWARRAEISDQGRRAVGDGIFRFSCFLVRFWSYGL